MDREKSLRRPFGFVSFSSEKTAEEVLRQQRHSVNGASIEVRPAKPRPSEQQQMQMQQQYQYGEYILPHHHHNTLISSISAPTMTHQSIMNVHPNQSSYYTHTSNNNNYPGQIDQWSQGANNGGSYWSTANNDIRNNNNNNSISQWSTGSNGGLSSVSGNNSVYGTLGNSASSSSSVYQQQNQGQSMYNPSGINQQGQYTHSNYSNHLQPSYGISSSQSTGNMYGGAYPSASQLIPSNDIQSSSSSWSQYAAAAAAANLANGGNQTNYDPNMYYAPYYANLFAQQYYPQQQQQQQQQQQAAANPSQAQIPIEQTISPNGYPTSSNGGLDKNYQHLSR